MVARVTLLLWNEDSGRWVKWSGSLLAALRYAAASKGLTAEQKAFVTRSLRRAELLSTLSSSGVHMELEQALTECDVSATVGNRD